MRIVLFILAGVVLLLFVLLFTNIGKNPSRKSSKMLLRELGSHQKRLGRIPPGSPKYAKALEDINVVVKELDRRAKEEDVQQDQPENGRPTAERLRQIAEDGYVEAAAKAKAQGKTDRQTHETALIGALLKRLQVESDMPPVTEELVGALGLEMLPFNVIPPNEGCRAIIEYVVWRERPDEADVELVKDAVRKGIGTMLQSGGSDIVENLRKAQFPWTSLLP